MKSLLILTLLNVGFVSMAQTARQSTTHTEINDDGKTMSVRVEGQVDGRAIDYQHTFDVARLSSLAKDDLKHRIFDSLGIGDVTKPLLPPVPPAPPGRSADAVDSPGRSAGAVDSPGRPEGGTFYGDFDTDEQQNVTFRCETCTGKIKLALTRSTEDYSFERDTKIDGQKRFFPYDIPLPPGEYRLKYFQNDILQIQSTFTVKSGQANTVVVK